MIANLGKLSKPSKPYRYRPASGRGLSRRSFEADSLRELGEQIANAERESGFRSKIFDDAGVLIAPPGTSRIALKTAVIRRVGRARQNHFARAAAEAGELWTYAPANPGREVVSARSWEDLAKKVAVWGVKTFVGTTPEPSDIFGAVEETVSGRILRAGVEVKFFEPVRNSDADGRSLDSATQFFAIVERAMLYCKAHVDEIERLMVDKATRTVQHLVDLEGRCGIVVGVLKDVVDDEGRRHPFVAVVDVGAGTALRLGVARGRSESEADYASRAESLAAKEVEFARAVDDGFLLAELPKAANGFSKAARDRAAAALGR